MNINISSEQIKNNAHLKVGEKVICIKNVYFPDNTSHQKGEMFVVEPKTQAYFSLFTGIDDFCNYLKIN
jgi:hypothetical protein